jgi:hypothetical protein
MNMSLIAKLKANILKGFCGDFLFVSQDQILYTYSFCLMQALVGVISNNFRFVAISQKMNGALLVTIILEKENDEDMEEVEDLKTEFEALFPRRIDYDFDVKISSDPIKWTDRSAIVVFARREAEGGIFDYN